MAYTPINKGQFTLETPERAAAFEEKRGFGCAAAYLENRRQWTEYPQQRIVSDYPLHVDLELASICNLRCPMCYTITDDFKKRVDAKLMDFDLFCRLIDECVTGGVYSIRLSFRGEAFLHPKVVDCVRYAKERGIQEVSSLTNGLRMDEEMFVELMEAGIDWLTFSIDGIGETYEQIRRPSLFDDMVAKLTAFKKIKEQAGRVKPAIKVQSILPAIEADPKAFYDIFAPISDMVSANPLIDYMTDTHKHPKITDFTCPQPFQRLVIGADGLAMLCSNDEVGEEVIGNANTQSIGEIWHGPKMTRAREIHIAHKACESLAPCGHCYIPLKTYDEVVMVGGRSVVAEKYAAGKDKLADIDTPKRWKRKDLEI
jgi:sulfatase maturation enzyme AslB (radical SAM superfamily)